MTETKGAERSPLQEVEEAEARTFDLLDLLAERLAVEGPSFDPLDFLAEFLAVTGSTFSVCQENN